MVGTVHKAVAGPMLVADVAGGKQATCLPSPLHACPSQTFRPRCLLLAEKFCFEEPSNTYCVNCNKWGERLTCIADGGKTCLASYNVSERF